MTQTDSWWVFEALADLYTRHERWPTAEEFAAHVGMDVTDELRAMLEEMRLATEKLVAAIAAREAGTIT